MADLRLSRRDYLRLATAGVLGSSGCGWFGALARAAGADPQRKKSCILLWMGGGPSQIDTFDLKPGHANGGSFKEIETAVPGIRISEHLPKIARHMDNMAIIRSMSTKQGDHLRASVEMHIGYPAEGPIRYPAIGSIVAKELGSDTTALPHFIHVGAFGVSGSGYLGPKYAPLSVGDPTLSRGDNFLKSLRIANMTPPEDVTDEESAARLSLLHEMQKDFETTHKGRVLDSRHSAYERAVKLMQTTDAAVFDIEKEPQKARDAYGQDPFGQSCLLARRLVEHGVPFVEVNGSSPGWDSHGDNFTQQQRMSELIDTPWAALMSDLKERGLLDSTLIIWMGEFGRTPKINQQNGRDHFPLAWTTVLAGGGIKGGQAVGKTSEDGMSVEERPVSQSDFLATVCKILGIDHSKQYVSNIGRPIRIVDAKARAVTEVVA